MYDWDEDEKSDPERKKMNEEKLQKI